MSGAYVPYHLRQNKAVDRQLFIDLLSKLNRFRSIGDFRYFSFGGAFLEDFKLLHSHFGNQNLTSIENDVIAFARQNFNLPLKCIVSINQDSSTFVDNFENSDNSIIWLDFASPKQLRQQIQEFEAILSKMIQYDTLKVTLNANPNALYRFGQKDENGRPESTNTVLEKRLKKLSDKLGDMLPVGTSSENMTDDGLSLTLAKTLEFAANQAMMARQAEGLYFQPLTTFSYADSEHQMLTLSGIILSKKERSEFFKATKLKTWKLATLQWGQVNKIRVPALTAHEKIFIDKLLPNATSKTIQKKLKFQFDSNSQISLEIIENYRKYYRYYPNFHRVTF